MVSSCFEGKSKVLSIIRKAFLQPGSNLLVIKLQLKYLNLREAFLILLICSRLQAPSLKLWNQTAKSHYLQNNRRQHTLVKQCVNNAPTFKKKKKTMFLNLKSSPLPAKILFLVILSPVSHQPITEISSSWASHWSTPLSSISASQTYTDKSLCARPCFKWVF